MRPLIAALGFLPLVSLASAHDQWADGSAVPSWVKASCCGPAEAHHLTPDQVHRVSDDAYRIDGVDALIPVSRALPSQDGEYWAFYADGIKPAPTVHCLFIPLSF